MPIVPDEGEEGRVRWGAREINRTRDFVAETKELIKPIWPVNQGGTGADNKRQAKTNLGITISSSNPSGGVDGDIWFKVT